MHSRNKNVMQVLIYSLKLKRWAYSRQPVRKSVTWWMLLFTSCAFLQTTTDKIVQKLAFTSPLTPFPRMHSKNVIGVS